MNLHTEIQFFKKYGDRVVPDTKRENDVPETVTVSSRGRITLPSNLRKRLGIKGGDTVILEYREGEIVLKPGGSLKIRNYSDAQIARWDAKDRLDRKTRARILDKVSSSL